MRNVCVRWRKLAEAGGAAMDRDIGFSAVFAAPCFALGVRCDGQRVLGIEFLPSQAARPARDSLSQLVLSQLAAYFDDPACGFRLPLATEGSVFQRRVWAEIAAIPSGSIRHYGDLAHTLGSSARAVGQACGANPYPVVVPCHRVLAKAAGGASALGGFAHSRASDWLAIKRWLLLHEGASPWNDEACR